MNNVRGVKNYTVYESLQRRTLITTISMLLEYYGYKYVEVPTLVDKSYVETAVEGTENRAFYLDSTALMPEVTNYIRAMGQRRLGADKVYYVAKCFRNETTTDSERLREFTQIGVELLGANSLDCRKVVRRDAINLFVELFPKPSETYWALNDDVERGLNLYDSSGKTFEIVGADSTTRKQLLGGGPYEGGAGWALGLERLMKALQT